MAAAQDASAGTGKERANVDIFRVQDGKVAEHWDYQETFPAETSRRKTTTAASDDRR